MLSEATIDMTASDIQKEWMSKLDSLTDDQSKLGGLNTKPGRLIVPIGSANWHNHPIWHYADNVTIEGAGQYHSTLTAMPGVPNILFMRHRAGWNRDLVDPKGNKYLATIPAIFADDHRFDLYGFADQTLVSGPGRAWGLKTRSPSSGSPYPDHQIIWRDAPPASGNNDYFRGWNCICFSILFRLNAGRLVCGIGSEGRPTPFFISRRDDGYIVWFQVDNFEQYVRHFTFGNSTYGQVTRLSFKIDFLTGVVKTWQNYQEVTTIQTWGCGPELLNQSPKGNDFGMFAIGAEGNSDMVWGDQLPLTDRGDIDLGNFALSSKNIYSSDSNGKMLVNGVPATDGTVFTNPNSITLNTSQRPLSDYQGREIRANHIDGTWPLGLFIPAASDLIGFQETKLRVNNISFNMGHASGPAITLGPDCGDVLFEEVGYRGGTVGFSLSRGSSDYYLQFNRCSGYGSFAQMILDSCIAKIYDPVPSYVGSNGLIVRGSTLTLNNYSMIAWQTPNPECLIKILNGQYGSSYDIGKIGLDEEGNVIPSKGYIYAEKHSTKLTLLIVRGIAMGPSSTNLLTLEDFTNNDANAAYCRIEDPIYDGVIAAHKPGWTVEIPYDPFAKNNSKVKVL